MPIISALLQDIDVDRREAELLLAFALQKDRSYVKAHAADKVNAKIAKRFLSFAKRRAKHEPIAYLIGSQPFYGRDFAVNRHTLIPRPETEVLAELVTKYVVRGTRYARLQTIVDIGTGSGCLAVTLALECPNATVIASDISSDALKVAKQNAKRLNANVEFVKDNLLGKKLSSVIARSSTTKQSTRDVGRLGRETNLAFVANLPYLPSTDKKTMMQDVVKFEPHKALFACRDGSALVVKLLKQIRDWNIEFGIWNLDRKSSTLNSKFQIQNSIFLELDPRQTKKLAALARKLFPHHKVSIEQDLCGRERFLTVT